MKVLKYPAPELLRESEPVDLAEAQTIVAKLEKACKQQSWGEVVGMAAPQIGINKRVFIALGKPYINPWIVWRPKHRKNHLEGCYSLEDNRFDYKVTRRSSVRLKWQDLDGVEHTYRFYGQEAQVIQHEYDHLEGKLCGTIEVSDLVATNNQSQVEPLKSAINPPSDPKRKANT